MSKGSMLRLTEDQLSIHQSWKDRVAGPKVDAVDAATRPPFKLTPVVEPETSVLANVGKILNVHRRVVWSARMNVAAGKLIFPDGTTSQWMQFGFVGCSDYVGMLIDGKFMACECKVVGEEPTDEQQTFLDLVNRNNGIGFVARNIDDVLRALGPA